MDRFSELLNELAQAERHVAEGQARIARQAEFVRELDASGHDTDFSAKRLMVMATNLTEMQEHRQQVLRALSVAQKRAATTRLH